MTTTDDDGATASDKLTVTIRNIDPPERSLIVYPDLVQVKEIVTVTAAFTNIHAQTAYTLEWAWGNGRTQADKTNQS